ncbi:MAG: hypothetical protein MUD04_05100 [Cyanobium sp. Prado107]|nr:hypothetical protein [Cyanobium sp. Prado107]
MADPAASRLSLPGASVPAAALAFLAAQVLGPLVCAPALAQRQTWMLGPGSQVAPSTKVVPTNCVTAPDGSITCDAELRNPSSNTPARPRLDLFEN